MCAASYVLGVRKMCGISPFWESMQYMRNLRIVLGNSLEWVRTGEGLPVFWYRARLIPELEHPAGKHP